MAQLAFSIGGAIIGGVIGSIVPGIGTALGANIGLIVGGIAGQLLFPTKQPPHVFDNHVSASTYGIPIPLAWGTIRLPGNMIWSTPIQEHSHHAGIGKGGLSSGQTTYSYTASFAFAFAKGPAVDVLRIWGDGKLGYDKRHIGSLVTNPDGSVTRQFLSTPNELGTWRFYKGDEEQLPDALIESFVGTGNESAHRGLCYIVFENFDLTNFANRIPNITAEIAFAVSEDAAIRYTDDLVSANGGAFGTTVDDVMAFDPNRNLIYANALGTVKGYRVFNASSFVEVRQKVDTTAFNPGCLMVGASGYLYRILSAAGNALVKIDPNSLEIVATGPSMDNVYANVVEVQVLGSDASVGRTFLIGSPSDGTPEFQVLDSSDMSFLVSHDFADGSFVAGLTKGETAIGTSNAYSIRQSDAMDGNSSVIISKIELNSFTQLIPGGGEVGINFTDLATIPSTTWNNNGNGTSALVFQPSDGSLLFWKTRLDATGSYLIKWQSGIGVVWTVETGTGVPNSAIMSENSRITGTNIGWTDGTTFTLINLEDGVILLNALAASTISPGGSSWGFSGPYNGVQFYDGPSESVVICKASPSILGQAFLRIPTGLGVTVRQIVEDVSAVVGLDSTTDIDATTLTDNVRGYALVQQTTAADAIIPLGGLFFFDGVESDGKIVYVKRGQSNSFAHTQDGLIVGNDLSQGVVVETRTQEIEIPERFAISYMDYDQDYNTGTAPARRVREPTPAMRSRDTQTVQLPIVFSASLDAPAAIVEKMLFTLWNERISYSWQAPFDALPINPTDVGTITLNDGLIISTRVTKAIINADLSVSLIGVRQNAFVNDSDTVGQGNLGYPQQLPPGPLATALFLLDIPLLRDIDDTGGLYDRLYVAMNGYQSGWPGGSLWDSATGAVFAPTGVSAISGVAFGTVQTALLDTVTPSETDYIHTIRVYMTQGELSSVTYDEFIDNTNVLIIGSPTLQNWEIILFQNAVQQDDGSYILSNIIRGRRGTEFRTGTHVNGEIAIFPSVATVTSYLLPLSTLNATRFYKGVGFSQLPEQAQTQSLASTGAPLKPWTVADVNAAVSGSDVVITWNRRNRIANDLMDGTGTIPMSEQTESYSIDILSGHNGTVKRTLTSTSETVTYTSANITTDFGTLPATLYFRVYQISAAVGRGYSVESAITF